MEIRRSSVEDFLKLHELVGRIENIVQHPPHFYKIMLRYFGDTIILAEEEGELTGFLLGFVSQTNPEEYFIWQLGVDPRYRGRKIAGKIMEETIKAAGEKGCRLVSATVEIVNIPSQRLFESSGFQIVTSSEDGELINENGKLAIKNYYASGTDQIFYAREINDLKT
jgi:diaminobutyrate acetyltransferase